MEEDPVENDDRDRYILKSHPYYRVIYNETECAIAIDGHLAEWFALKISLRQRCLPLSTLFNRDVCCSPALPDKLSSGRDGPGRTGFKFGTVSETMKI